MIALAFNLLFTLALLCSATSTRKRRDASRCDRCEYSLVGLPPEGACPECGHPYSPAAEIEVPVAIRRRYVHIVRFTVPLALVYAVGMSSGVLPAISYRLMGYSWSVSRKAVFARDESDLNWACMQIGVFVALSPLLGVLRRDWAVRLFLVGILICALVLV